MQLSNIDISLSLGQLIWEKQRKAIIFFILISMLFPLLTIVMLFFSIIWEAQIIIAIAGMNIISLLLLILPIYLIINDCRNKKTIRLWLKDAIEKLDEYKSLFSKGITIQVDFNLNNKMHRKKSTVKVLGGGEAFLTTFSQYADKLLIFYTHQNMMKSYC